MTDPTPPDSAPEPSMEEILASIRQIISDDLASTTAGEPRSSAEADGDDVLVLRERAAPEPSPFASTHHTEPSASQTPAPEPDVPEALSPEQQAPEPQPPPAPEPHQAAEPEAPEPQVAEPQAAEPQVAESELAESQPTEPAPSEPATGRSLTLAPSSEPAVVEPHTAAAVAASFERLSFVVENQPHPPPFAVSGGGVTLEDITRDILTPVIKAWLDDNLPAIVQRRVDEEVERITRSRVR